MRDKIAVVVPFILISLAEVFFFFGDPSTTLSLHLLNIFACVLLSIFIERYSDVFQALMLISLLRVLNIGMPIFFSMTLYWMPFVYGTIIISGYILWRMTSNTIARNEEGIRNFKAFLSVHTRQAWDFLNRGGMEQKSHWNGLYLPAAIVIGLVLANMEYMVLGPTPLIPDMGLINLTVLAVVMVIFVGFGEELIFRGFLQARVERHWGTATALFTSAFTFSIMHSGYASLPYLLFVFFVGLVLAILFWKTRSLVFVALIHGILNFFLFSFLPYGWAIWY
jgi:membrane protease YdiL (CAAX protease family)